MADQARWWEHYYVRYFVGTAFAIPLLVLLAQQEPWKTAFAAIDGKDWLTAGAVAFGGLAFCYIASAPILLLHTMRAKILRTPRTYLWIVASIAGLGALALAGLWFLDRNTLKMTDSSVLLVPFTVVVGLQVALIGYGAWRPGVQHPPHQSGASQLVIANNIEEVRSFYVDVALRRAAAAAQPSGRPPRAEYVESYRHLREHGNAVLILVAETVLALALLYATNTVASLLVVVLWVLPAAIVWPMATWLEASMDSSSAT